MARKMNNRWVVFWKEKARALKVQTLALYFAYRDPRVPWYAKAWIAVVVAYAFSPIDLIPDFIPILGYLDDLLIVPAGIALTLALIPPGVMADARVKARTAIFDRRAGIIGAAIIVLIWILAIIVFALLIQKLLRKHT